MQESPFVVEIISIGEELLIGKIVNTNASWLSNRIVESGGKVSRITVIGDDVNQIASVLMEAISRRPNMVITTGGLGPTYDDKTLLGIAKAIGGKMELNKEALNHLEKACGRRRVELDEVRKKMAYAPRGSSIIENPVGLAPGIIVDYEGVMIVALPGVPEEMKAMFNESILRRIRGGRYHEVELHVRNVYEADLAPIIEEIVRKNPQVYLKSHPRIEKKMPHIILHIYSNMKSKDEILEICEKIKIKIVKIGGEIIRIIGD